MQTGRLRMGDIEVDLRSAELHRQGRSIPLQEKPFQLLVALAERPGEVVLREELQERLWGETFVDFDNNLNASVKKLRAALGDSASHPRFVETVPRRGYRLIAPVERLPQPRAAEGAWAGRPASSGQPRTVAGRRTPLAASRLAWLLAAAMLLAALLVVWQSLEERPPSSATSGKIMLAVLPFHNLSSQSQDYFAEGLTEELITHLGRLAPRRLGVIARLSSMGYKGSGKDADVIGRELGVDYVLQGSVRRQGDQARISVRLLQVSDGTHLWSENYPFELREIFQVQRQVAARVAKALAIQLLPSREDTLARAGTTDTAAFEAYLQGRYFWRTFERAGLLKSVEHFSRAVQLDSHYASAWAGLADAYNLLAFQERRGQQRYFPLAEEAARKALQADPLSAEGHNSLAYALLYGHWDLEGARRHFAQAVAIRPAYAMAYHWQAGALSASGRHQQAIESMQRSLAMEPKDLSVVSDLGWYYLYADRWQEGRELCQRTVDESNYGWAKSCLASAEDHLGNPGRALQLNLEMAPTDTPDQLKQRLRSLDDAGEALRQWRLHLLQGAQNQEAPLWKAQLNSLLGRADEAFEILEALYQEREPWLIFLNVDPHWDRLHSDPRFQDLWTRIRQVSAAQ
ncbi:MAG TPA: winged helix-turn-helix domain-containing protein [Acidobacteriota bacterium]|nr:winged helix-turn-helix domain-containing protein [Acidobacteriota bacterium]